MTKSNASRAVSPYLRARALAEVELRRRRRARSNLYGIVPHLNPRYAPPVHLDPLVQHLERSWTEPVRVTAHAPPRHAKTETVLAFAALTLLRQPWRTLAYVTYESNLAKSKSRKVRALAEFLGVKVADGARRLDEWRTEEGGGFLATGIGGPLTGRGVDILLVDDPYKNRIQAESGAYRRMVADWWADVGDSRIEPGGSAFIFHTRWVADDLISHVLEGGDGSAWTNVVMPALSDAGLPLWPERWPLEALLQKQRSAGPYTWASLYQGRPRPRGGALFGDVCFYSELPGSFRIAIGVDLAYSEASAADYSVAVVLACAEVAGEQRYFVLDVLRLQVGAPAFAARLKHLWQGYGKPPLRWYCAGVEKGSASFFQKEGLPIDARSAGGDKFIRAQPVAAAWNAGRVLLPAAFTKAESGIILLEKQHPWADDFVSETAAFTGVRDKHDDQVDALAAAYDLLETSADTTVMRIRSTRL